jgi:hypothetical protein
LIIEPAELKAGSLGYVDGAASLVLRGEELITRKRHATATRFAYLR